MNSLSSRAAVTAIASLLLVGSAYAQTPAPAPAPAANADTKMAPTDKKAARSAASLECSKEADGKSLHGKERKKFMSDCKKEAKAKAM
jgi:psiF repeat-containing protein